MSNPPITSLHFRQCHGKHKPRIWRDSRNSLGAIPVQTDIEMTSHLLVQIDIEIFRVSPYVLTPYWVGWLVAFYLQLAFLQATAYMNL